MPVLKRLSLAVLLAVPVAAHAATDTYAVDPMHSSVNFTVDHLGLTNIYGRFNKFTGTFAVDKAAKTGSLDASVDTVSVDTNENDKGSRARSRDEHLRSADFFNAAEFPKMTYKSTKVAFTGDNPSAVEGNLTLLGVTHPVALTIERFKCNPASGNAKERCGGVAVGKLKRSDFGMKRGVPNIGDEITLVLAFEGDKQ
jgi:polyisoprenoid-binding protein YceI